MPETAATPRLGRRAAVVLTVTSAVVFVVFLDATIVNVAFETISRDLHAGASRLAWVLNAYSLTFAAMLIPAGRPIDTGGDGYSCSARQASPSSAHCADSRPPQPVGERPDP